MVLRLVGCGIFRMPLWVAMTTNQIVALLHPGLFFDDVAGADSGLGLESGNLEPDDVQSLLSFVVGQVNGEVLGAGLPYLLPEVDLFRNILGLIVVLSETRRRVGDMLLSW